MFFKSLIATLVVMVLTGGFIYFSSAPTSTSTSKSTSTSTPEDNSPEIKSDAPLIERGSDGPAITAKADMEAPSVKDTPQSEVPSRRNSGWVNLAPKRQAAKAAPKTEPKTMAKTLNEGLEDAGVIKDKDLQDKAYLSLIETAIEEKAYSRAYRLVEKIESEAFKSMAREKLDAAIAVKN